MTVFSQKVLLHRLGLDDKQRGWLSTASTIDSNKGSQVLACSVFTRDDDRVDRILRASEDGRRLLSDRKQPFEQFTPRRLVISTARVVGVQASTTVSYFLTDQLDSEMKREKLVKEGKLTEAEADRLNDEWEQREWKERWSTFGTRCIHGVLKFHAITLVMRFYEHVASNMVDAVTLDRLTKDPFKAALRTKKVVSSDKKEMIRPMYETCLWSNVIAFLADYTVHQVILAFTYYMYCRDRKRRRLAEREEAPSEEEESNAGPMAMSFTFKSSMLMVSRSLGLIGAASGGALGSYLYPGWGTTIGTAVGDSLVSTALEERS